MMDSTATQAEEKKDEDSFSDDTLNTEAAECECDILSRSLS